RSTDFEVHRNWLAITHSLPIKKWYVEDTSEWTLDYPPLFAWFEWLMSQVAFFVDPDMLQVSNLNYASDATVIFQRVSVILTDFVFYYAINEWSLTDSDIHFQYNGILFGIMLLSIVRILQDRPLEGAFWFSVLLNMKHIYMYIAPPYFVYLLRTYCFKISFFLSISQRHNNFDPTKNTTSLNMFCFTSQHQLGQVMSRLFPFKRGLVHAYWAPNVWALYNGADKFLTILGLRMGFLQADAIPAASMTGGMVQEYSHVVLPSIAPLVTLILTALGMLPALYMLWELKSPTAFVRSIILCAFTSFLFGWHVHEKAILMIIIPLTLLVKHTREDARLFLLLSLTGYYSLFPLLFTPFVICPPPSAPILARCLGMLRLPLLSDLEGGYLWGLAALRFFNDGILLRMLGIDLLTRLPFLPLMLTSTYCAVGVIYCWLRFYRYFLWVEGSSEEAL
ncbi:hypothetical protein EGW08_016614, partial [Elysia chlorotica]